LETLGDDHDPSNAVAALAAIHDSEQNDKHVTGLLYYDSEMKTADEALGLTDTPLVDLTEEELRPSKQALEELNQSFRA
jgi:2-oxoglutarate ferredoxin oxidoreductase subunit beta